MSETPTESTSRPPNRWVQLLVGIALGFAWGSLMWGLATVIGQDTGGARGWLLIAIPMGMIGGGVAAVFGARGARSRGERLGPRMRR